MKSLLRKGIILGLSILILLILLISLALHRLGGRNYRDAKKYLNNIEGETQSSLAGTEWRLTHYWIIPGVKIPADFYFVVHPRLSFGEDGQLECWGYNNSEYRTNGKLIALTFQAPTEYYGEWNPAYHNLLYVYPNAQLNLARSARSFEKDGNVLILYDSIGPIQRYEKEEFGDCHKFKLIIPEW